MYRTQEVGGSSPPSSISPCSFAAWSAGFVLSRPQEPPDPYYLLLVIR
jgi:hypothetical protein